MRILSISIEGHDTSGVILNNGKIEFYLPAERISRSKHEHDETFIFNYFREKNLVKFDHIVVDCYRPSIAIENEEDVWKNECLISFNEFSNIGSGYMKEWVSTHLRGFTWKYFKVNNYDHHLHHAYSGFYHSNFDEALCIILDGHGSERKVKGKRFFDCTQAYEIESIYIANKKSIEMVSKRYHEDLWRYVKMDTLGFCPSLMKWTNRGSASLFVSNPKGKQSVGHKFQELSHEYGFGWHSAGKIMGLAQYKGYESEINEIWKGGVEGSYKVQKETEEEVIEIIKKYSEKTGINNIVISGGYALNCVANYKFTKLFPHLNFFIDPICADVGICIGQAYRHYKKYSLFKRISPLKNVYLGSKPNYNLKFLKTTKTSYKEVAQLLNLGKVISLCQGRSEAGFRALGNRSLLMDPRIPDGRDRLNKIKGREDFRPFAGTVLKEYANEWFDVEESQYMQYAVKVKKDGIPAMIHIDNTCRVQTVTKKQNKHYYNLIKAFYKLTGFPLVLNTSLNYAGEAIAEDLEQSIISSERMNLEYIFLPEKMLLVHLNKCLPS
tara:strand:- start:432 stop:2087 length:1656 start_codon:yes stop_codon:yes gene_type:complete